MAVKDNPVKFKSRNPSGDDQPLPAMNSFKDNVQRLLNAHPEGINIIDFTTVYQEHSGQPLNLEELGFTTLEGFLLSLSDNTLQLSYTGGGQILVQSLEYDDTRLPDPVVQIPRGPSGERLPLPAELPPDAVIGSHYRPQFVHSSCKVGEYLEVFVSNIASPGVFWLQFIGKKTTDELEKIMTALEFYKTFNGNRYRMPEHLIKIGQACAAQFPEDQNWHRVVITGIPSLDIVEVYYIDYGNTCTVPKSLLRLLRSVYLRLPVQAVRARLANIQPIGEVWTMAARDAMLQVCICRPLIATVIDLKDQILSVCLIDTTTDDDLHINDMLIMKGHAKFVADSEENRATSTARDQAVIPDDAVIYGQKRPNPDEVDAVAPPSDTAEKPAEIKQRWVQKVQLTDTCTVHLINISGVAYLYSAEVSSFLWNSDVVRSMLRKEKVELASVVVNKDDYLALFNELSEYQVPGIRQFLTLYELNGIPCFLDSFNSESLELKSAIESLIRTFSADNPYWAGGEDNQVPSNTAISEPEMDLEDLKLSLQALTYKRKRILQNMFNGADPEASVNEMNSVETMVALIKGKIKSLTKTAAATPANIFVDPAPAKAASNTVNLPTKGASGNTSVSAEIKTNVVTPQPRAKEQARPSFMQQPGIPSLPQAGLPTFQPGLPTGGAASLLAQQQQMYQSMMMSQAATMTPQMLSMMGNMPYSPLMVPGMMPYSSMMQSQPMTFPVPGVRPNLTLMPELLSLLNLTQGDSSMQAPPPSGEKERDPKS